LGRAGTLTERRRPQADRNEAPPRELKRLLDDDPKLVCEVGTLAAVSEDVEGLVVVIGTFSCRGEEDEGDEQAGICRPRRPATNHDEQQCGDCQRGDDERSLDRGPPRLQLHQVRECDHGENGGESPGIPSLSWIESGKERRGQRAGDDHCRRQQIGEAVVAVEIEQRAERVEMGREDQASD
jgi:hypothetical protein